MQSHLLVISLLITVLNYLYKSLDVETTHKEKKNGGHTPLPYFGNKLVSVGYKYMDSLTSYLCFNHRTQAPEYKGDELLQDALDNVDVLIGHNIKFDISWLRECGFRYDGHLYDTMVAEYVLASARRWGSVSYTHLTLPTICRE